MRRLLLCTCCERGLLLTTGTLILLLLLLPGVVNGDCLASEIPFVTLGDKGLNASYPIGTTLRYRCIPGFTPKAFILQCRNDSTWSESCQRMNCKVPVFENGEIKGNLTYGEKVSFTCNEGYILLGRNTSRCSLGESSTLDWSPAAPHCERIACERPPTIVNGLHSGDHDDHYTVGTVVIYTCNKDFSLIGQSSLECIVAEDGRYGKWKRDPPQCKVVKCDGPRIENGKLTSGFKASYTYNEVINYICNVGYIVLENELIRCVANSTWHPTPKCVKVPATTTVPVHPGGNSTLVSATTTVPVHPGENTTSVPATTTVPVHPGENTTSVSGPSSATIAVGKLSLIMALLILTVWS